MKMKLKSLEDKLLTGSYKAAWAFHPNGTKSEVTSAEEKDGMIILRTEDKSMVPLSAGNINVIGNVAFLDMPFGSSLSVEL